MIIISNLMEKIIGKRPAYRNLEVDKIKLPESDLRQKIDEKEIEQLGDSMKDVGQLQPIIVSYDTKAKKHQVIIGGRRLRAALKKGMPTIRATIVDEIEDKHELIVRLIENMQRSDLEPLEEARGIAALRDTFNYSEDQIVATIKKSGQFVRDRLSLLSLPPSIVQLVEQGKLGVSQATSIAKLEGSDQKQETIASKAVERNLPTEVVVRMVNEVLRPKRRRKKMARKHKLKKERRYSIERAYANKTSTDCSER